MEPSIYRYVLKHTYRDQVLLLLLTAAALPLVYVTLEIPKRIINEAIGGKGMPYSFFGIELDQIQFLLLLCFAYLGLVIVNGGLKYANNVYRGIVGERMLRRLRYDLYTRILRFPLPHFKHTSQGELIPMVIAETEPLGGFIGEAFALPVYQGGLLLTYLFFIFNQDILLGIASIMMYPLQMYVVPKLQRKVNDLNRQRVRKVRVLSDRIGETVSGISEIHAHDTTHFARAAVSSVLGSIFHIRYDVFRRKFFIKFLNNFLDKITPFFFYSVGGYLVIVGNLSLGALVAALAAYKDISDPWKTLLKYYQTKEDARVKYTQVIEQFQPKNMLPESILDADAGDVESLRGTIVCNNLSYSEDGAERLVDGVSFELEAAAHAIFVGVGNSGKDELAMLLARLLFPTGGRITINDKNLAEMPEAVVGRRIAYVGQNAFIFSGSVRDNLFYSLKHKPLCTSEYDEDAKSRRQHEIQAALAAGNSPDDVSADWVDYASANVAEASDLERKALEIISLVDVEEEMYQLGLRGSANAERYPELIEGILEARDQVRHRLEEPEFVDLVQPFSSDLYNTNMSVAENLLFGSTRDPEFSLEGLATNAHVRRVLDEIGIAADLIETGKRVAETMIELFADVDPDSALFEQFSFIRADDLPVFKNLLSRIEERGGEELSKEEEIRLLSLSFKLVPSQHRLGLIDDRMQSRLLDARHALSPVLAALESPVEEFDPERFNAAISIQDNILFGKLNPGQARAQEKIAALIAEAIEKLGLRAEIVKAGLEYEVGIGGTRLSLVLRQKLAIARCLLKDPDVFIVNQATGALDPATEVRLLHKVIEYRKGSSLIWMSDRAELARYFDLAFVMAGGKLCEQGSFDELSTSGSLFPRLLGAAG